MCSIVAMSRRTSIVNLSLAGARVTAPCRDAIFAAADRVGVGVSEFCIRAAAEKLIEDGAEIPGVFEPGDVGGIR
ncbi:hypothetical protein NB311A_05028 [Nitrobacter sp. Nb-311A]|nr:hypothetical protein NB311A_05028 [Nitrobacter sp. Nb-311A]